MSATDLKVSRAPTGVDPRASHHCSVPPAHSGLDFSALSEIALDLERRELPPGLLQAAKKLWSMNDHSAPRVKAVLQRFAGNPRAAALELIAQGLLIFWPDGSARLVSPRDRESAELFQPGATDYAQRLAAVTRHVAKVAVDHGVLDRMPAELFDAAIAEEMAAA